MEYGLLGLLHRGGGDTLAAFTCIWTRVGGCLIRESESPLTLSIPSGGVMGLQNWPTLEVGAV